MEGQIMTNDEIIEDYYRLKLEYTRLHEDYRRLDNKQSKLFGVSRGLPTKEELIIEARKVAAKTERSKTPTTEREITLGERAYINGGLWVLSQTVND
jgi:hypothetical protein